jgi:hemerythrin-like domain-containing protein
MDKTLDLKDRDGLPDALRGLLEAFPRDAWDAHPHFAGLVAFWMDRHQMFRKLCTLLRADAEAVVDGQLALPQMQARLSRYGGILVQQLHGHHHIEDAHYFPLLSGREPALGRGFELLDADHHALDGLLARFTEGANGVLRGTSEPGRFHDGLAEFDRLLLRHLADEEDLVVPVILKHGPDGLA